MDTIKDKLQGLLNFASSNGEVITLFNGKITLSQLIVGIGAIAVIIIALKFLKKTVRTVTLIGAICFALVHYGLATPTQLKDVGMQIAQDGVAKYQAVAEMSENIQLNNNSISIKIEDKWVSLDNIQSFVSTGDDSVSITVDGQSYAVNDKSVVQLLNMFK